MELLSGLSVFVTDGLADGPDFLFGEWDYGADVVPFSNGLAHEVDLCLAGPDEYNSGRSSPMRDFVPPWPMTSLMCWTVNRSMRHLPLSSRRSSPET